MSLWSRNELDIALSPGRIEMLHVERKLTLRGYQSRVRTSETIPCEIPAAGEPAWSGALRMLEMKLASSIKSKADVSVTLSNHFMHYMLVPWFDEMNDEEEMVFARHCFSDVYGSAADSWSVRISPGKAGDAALASAVDSRLLEELRGLFKKTGFTVKSIQPRLMAAFNSCQAGLRGRSAWVALLEPGNLCLAVLRQGKIVWIRKLRIGEAWQEELSTILEREAYLSDAEVVSNELFLWAPHLEDSEMPELGRWKIQNLDPSLEPDRLQVTGGLQTLAVES